MSTPGNVPSRRRRGPNRPRYASPAEAEAAAARRRSLEAALELGGDGVPHPIPVPEIADDSAPTRRRLDCATYRGCLGVAVELDWSGFACGECHTYSPIGPAEKLAEGLRVESWLRTGGAGEE